MGVLSKLMAAAATTTALTACVPTGNSSYTEDYNGNGYRTPIQQEPVDCVTTTVREGTTDGLNTYYNSGRVRQTCTTAQQNTYDPSQALLNGIIAGATTAIIYEVLNPRNY